MGSFLLNARFRVKENDVNIAENKLLDGFATFINHTFSQIFSVVVHPKLPDDTVAPCGYRFVTIRIRVNNSIEGLREKFKVQAETIAEQIGIDLHSCSETEHLTGSLTRAASHMNGADNQKVVTEKPNWDGSFGHMADFNKMYTETEPLNDE